MQDGLQSKGFAVRMQGFFSRKGGLNFKTVEAINTLIYRHTGKRKRRARGELGSIAASEVEFKYHENQLIFTKTEEIGRL
jgi:hypothetical protein